MRVPSTARKLDTTFRRPRPRPAGVRLEIDPSFCIYRHVFLRVFKTEIELPYPETSPMEARFQARQTRRVEKQLLFYPRVRGAFWTTGGRAARIADNADAPDRRRYIGTVFRPPPHPNY